MPVQHTTKAKRLRQDDKKVREEKKKKKGITVHILGRGRLSELTRPGYLAFPSPSSSAHSSTSSPQSSEPTRKSSSDLLWKRYRAARIKWRVGRKRVIKKTLTLSFKQLQCLTPVPLNHHRQLVNGTNLDRIAEEGEHRYEEKKKRKDNKLTY